MSRRGYLVFMVALGVPALLARAVAAGAAPYPAVEIVSLSGTGAQGNGDSYPPEISANGRYVAFASYATNFSPPGSDTNSTSDVFRRDLLTGDTTRVSVSTAGVGANAQTYSGGICGDGSRIVMNSLASNLVLGDANGRMDIFVRDLDTGETTIASQSTSGTYGDDSSSSHGISDNGRYVVFESHANNLVTPLAWDDYHVYRRDLDTKTTVMSDVSSSGAQGYGGAGVEPDVSADGRYVVFCSRAGNLVGEAVNGFTLVFVHDHVGGDTTLASVNDGGTQSNADCEKPAISADGRHVAFKSGATNLGGGGGAGGTGMDVYLRDLDTRETTLVSVSITGGPGNSWSCWTWKPRVSSDGRYVVFTSLATNLVPSDTNGQEDVFMRDLVARETTLVSRSASGTQGNGASNGPCLTPDATKVAFFSFANNLVDIDTNARADCFLWGGIATSTAVPTTQTTALTIARSKSLVSYNGAVALAGKLTGGGAGLPSRTVSLYRQSKAGGGWMKVGDVTTSGDGSYSFSTKMKVSSYFATVFLGEAGYEPTASPVVLVQCRAGLPTPYAPRLAVRYRPFTVAGNLFPRHYGRTRVSVYRLIGRRWRYYRSYYGWNRRYSTYARFGVRMRLPSGRYLVRSHHSDSSHYRTFSGPRVFTVR